MTQSGPSYTLYTESETPQVHSPAIMVNAVNSALISGLAGKTITINVVNHPLPRTQAVFQVNGLIVGINVVFVVTIGFSFLFAGIAAATVRERQFGAKAIQVQCGLSTSTYWASNFILDFVKYLVVAVFVIIFIAAFGISSLQDDGRLGAIAILLVEYGMAVMPFLYLFSFMFAEYGNA
jgi:ATP-binding cassette subfamily A (ABC1) protein 3